MLRFMVRIFLVMALCSALQVYASDVEPFSLQWMNAPDQGMSYDSATHEAAIYVVEAYFKNCSTCNDNAPNLNALAAGYANEPRVQVLDVSRDCRDADYRAWIATHKPNHPVLKDCALKLLSQLEIARYPTTVVLDCNLQPVFRHEGPWTPTVITRVRAVIDRTLRNNTCEVNHDLVQ